MPIIAVTDKNCDAGEIAVKNGYGLYCESDDVNLFICIVDEMLKRDRKKMGERGYQFFLDNYTVQHTYDAIMQHM
jgi:glycosyltransferase involved in cell wall biosynthesis